MNALDRTVFLLVLLVIGGLAGYIWHRQDPSRELPTGDTDERSSVKQGKVIYRQEGCNACHSVDGTKNTGPTMKGLFGTERKMKDGATVSADDEYVRESIRHPGRTVVNGFPDNMPPYDHLSKEQMRQLMEYIRFLSKENSGKENGNG